MKKFKVRIPCSITIEVEGSRSFARDVGRAYEGIEFTLPKSNQYPFTRLGGGTVSCGKTDVTDVEEIKG